MPEPNRAPFDWKGSLPYLAPFTFFMAYTVGLEPLARPLYPYAYGAKLLAVVTVLFVFWNKFDELRVRPNWRAVALGAGVGWAIFALWAWLETPRGDSKHGLIPPLPLMGSRVGYNPFMEINGVFASYSFIGVRLLGMVVIVPMMEELLWRSWLIRIAVREDFKSVPTGTFTWTSCLISSGMFALVHPEWLSAFVTGLAYNFVLYRTKNLWACIVAHATTNLALGIYVVTTRTWTLW